MRVLIVEDDPKMAALLRQGLREEGDVVDVTDHGGTPCGRRKPSTTT